MSGGPAAAAPSIRAMTFELIALHRLTVARGNDATVQPIGAADVSQLSLDAVDLLEAYVADLVARDEALGSRATSGWFDPDEPPEITALREARDLAAFEDASLEAMGRLATLARGNASSGVVLFLSGGDGRLACFKLDPETLTRARIDPRAQRAAAAIGTAQLEDVLPEPRDVKKGALLPSPSGADARVVDHARPGDPAGYWVQFLGVAAIRATAVATSLMTEAEAALRRENVPAHRARALLTDRMEATAKGGEAVAPERFVRDLARDAGVDDAAAWEHVRGANHELAGPHAAVAPLVAKRLRRVVDLGGGVVLSGPAGEVDRRVEEGEDESGPFLKVRATAQPAYRTA